MRGVIVSAGNPQCVTVQSERELGEDIENVNGNNDNVEFKYPKRKRQATVIHIGQRRACLSLKMSDRWQPSPAGCVRCEELGIEKKERDRLKNLISKACVSLKKN